MPAAAPRRYPGTGPRPAPGHGGPCGAASPGPRDRNSGRFRGTSPLHRDPFRRRPRPAIEAPRTAGTPSALREVDRPPQERPWSRARAPTPRETRDPSFRWRPEAAARAARRAQARSPQLERAAPRRWRSRGPPIPEAVGQPRPAPRGGARGPPECRRDGHRASSKADRGSSVARRRGDPRFERNSGSAGSGARASRRAGSSRAGRGPTSRTSGLRSPPRLPRSTRTRSRRSRRG